MPNVRYWIDDQRGIPIADIKIHGNELADANLIAAAPDLLDALESMLNVEGPAIEGATFGAWDGLDVRWHFSKARAAIAKAKGEPS